MHSASGVHELEGGVCLLAKACQGHVLILFLWLLLILLTPSPHLALLHEMLGRAEDIQESQASLNH